MKVAFSWRDRWQLPEVCGVDGCLQWGR